MSETPGEHCDAVAHPNPGCVGVPPGTRLTVPPLDPDGNLVVTDPDVVVDAVHVPGSLLVRADGVTVRNSRIDGMVLNGFDDVVHPYTITDSTVGPETGCIGQPALSEANYTAVRVLVRGHDDGFRMSSPGNVVVRDSFARLCYRSAAEDPPDGSHSDGIQAYCPAAACENLTFAGNTVDSRGIPATFMINLNDPKLGGTIAIKDNLLAGGGYTIVTEWRSGPRWIVTGNSVVDRTWAYGPASGEGTCAQQDWSGNQVVTVDQDYRVTGVVAPLGCLS